MITLQYQFEKTILAIFKRDLSLDNKRIFYIIKTNKYFNYE